MKALEVRINGAKVCTAGIERQGAVCVGLQLTSLPENQEEIEFNVSGMECNDLNAWRKGQTENLSWDKAEVRPGDTLTIQIVEAGKLTKPTTRKPAEFTEAEDPAMVEQRHRALFEWLKSQYGW